jgi:hypothetical protein
VDDALFVAKSNVLAYVFLRDAAREHHVASIDTILARQDEKLRWGLLDSWMYRRNFDGLPALPVTVARLLSARGVPFVSATSIRPTTEPHRRELHAELQAAYLHANQLWFLDAEGVCSATNALFKEAPVLHLPGSYTAERAIQMCDDCCAPGRTGLIVKPFISNTMKPLLTADPLRGSIMRIWAVEDLSTVSFEVSLNITFSRRAYNSIVSWIQPPRSAPSRSMPTPVSLPEAFARWQNRHPHEQLMVRATVAFGTDGEVVWDTPITTAALRMFQGASDSAVRTSAVRTEEGELRLCIQVEGTWYPGPFAALLRDATVASLELLMPKEELLGGLDVCKAPWIGVKHHRGIISQRAIFAQPYDAANYNTGDACNSQACCLAYQRCVFVLQRLLFEMMNPR